MSQTEQVAIRFTSEITVREVMQVGTDDYIAAAAWVSTSANDGIRKAQAEPAKVDGLIRYLMQHRHGSPFEHGMLTLYVHAPIFVWREWHRHRIGHAFNEESARYKTLDPVFYMPPKSRPMYKVDDWKPGRPKFLKYDETGTAADQVDAESKYLRLVDNLKESYTLGYTKYLENLAMGFDPGLARDCLPVGIYSSCWVTVNPRSMMHFLSLRTHEPTAQKVSYPLYEIDSAARQVEAIFAKRWPMTHAAWNAFGRVAP